MIWHKEDALHLLQDLSGDPIGVFGGDVYLEENEKIKSLYDNWACQQHSTESVADYYIRSKLHALAYIRIYPIQNEGSILFGIVFTHPL